MSEKITRVTSTEIHIRNVTGGSLSPKQYDEINEILNGRQDEVNVIIDRLKERILNQAAQINLSYPYMEHDGQMHPILNLCVADDCDKCKIIELESKYIHKYDDSFCAKKQY